MDDPGPLDDLDPSAAQATPVRWSAEYHLAFDAAFDVLLIDLNEVRGGPDLEMYGDAIYVLGRMDELRSLYQRQIDGEEGGHVPFGMSNWTIADEVRVLRHLAVLIHDHRLSEAAFGDEHLLRKFWEYGRLRSVENMCHNARRDQATDRSDDLQWLMDNGAPRQASEAADLTSQQPAPAHRARRRAGLEPAEQVAAMSRVAVERGQAESLGR